MIEILNFYKQTHSHMVFVHFVYNGRRMLTNGYFMFDETPSRMRDLEKVKRCNVTDLIRNLNYFYPDHDLTKFMRSMKWA